MLERVYKTMPYYPKLADCLVYHHHHKASSHPIISILIHCFYLQCPSAHKCFDPWDFKCLLSLLESWTPVSSLTSFKLAWRAATLLALITVKGCSDLNLLNIDNQHLFSASCCYVHSCHWLQDRLTR